MQWGQTIGHPYPMFAGPHVPELEIPISRGRPPRKVRMSGANVRKHGSTTASPPAVGRNVKRSLPRTTRAPRCVAEEESVRRELCSAAGAGRYSSRSGPIRSATDRLSRLFSSGWGEDLRSTVARCARTADGSPGRAPTTTSSRRLNARMPESPFCARLHYRPGSVGTKGMRLAWAQRSSKR